MSPGLVFVCWSLPETLNRLSQVQIAIAKRSPLRLLVQYWRALDNGGRRPGDMLEAIE